MENFWISTLCEIEAQGDYLDSRNGGSREVLGFSKTLLYSRQSLLFNRVRKIDPSYACAEFLWYLTMTDDTTFLQNFAPSYSRFCEDGIHAHGAYGHRWNVNAWHDDHTIAPDQLTLLIETLKEHPNTRQAVMTMWDGTDLRHARDLDKKDLPCTLTHQFLLRNGYLCMITNMRSNDVWLGLPYDVFCNTQLQKLIATEIDSAVGSYTHNVGSMHMYDKNSDKVNEVLDAKQSRALDENDLPISIFKKGDGGWIIPDQTERAINYVLGDDKKVLQGLHTVISDCAIVCAAKFDRFDDVNKIYDPQLKRAVKEFYV
jgi:thymidylate synthase